MDEAYGQRVTHSIYTVLLKSNTHHVYIYSSTEEIYTLTLQHNTYGIDTSHVTQDSVFNSIPCGMVVTVFGLHTTWELHGYNMSECQCHVFNTQVKDFL